MFPISSAPKPVRAASIYLGIYADLRRDADSEKEPIIADEGLDPPEQVKVVV
jgi:hypothetical protein